MAIQTVTQETLAQSVRDASDKPDGSPVVSEGAETKDAPPPPQQAKEKQPKPVQPRIDELVREKKELDEAFQGEYEQRLRLEGELAALKSQLQPKAEEKKPEAEPKPADFTNQEEFLAKWGEWQRKKAREEFAAEQETARQREAMERANEQLAQRIARAKVDIPDFQDVIEDADRKAPIVPNHVKAAILESELGPQIAYHLAKHPDEQARIFKLSPAKALLELGKIEQQYAKGEPKDEPKADPPTITPKTPEPVARLSESPGIAPVDLSKPMAFNDYRKARLEQIRSSGRRRH